MSRADRRPRQSGGRRTGRACELAVRRGLELDHLRVDGARQCTKYNLKSYVRECFTLLIACDLHRTLEAHLMSSLDRAKQFLQNKSRTLALTVVPFAALVALAAPSKASVLTFAPGTPTLTQTAPSGSLATSNLSAVALDVLNGVSGVAGSGNGTLTNGISGSWTLSFDMAGSANGGIITAPIPVDWLFNFTSNVGAVLPWSLTLKLNGSPVTLTPSPDPVSGTIPGFGSQISGTALIPVVEGPINSYDLLLQINSGFPTVGTFTLGIPAGSTLDINPVSSTPEPSAFFLAAPGLALLLLKSRRRQIRA
jgi:hypothetical protein